MKKNNRYYMGNGLILLVFLSACSTHSSQKKEKFKQISESYESLLYRQVEKKQQDTLQSLCKFVTTEYFLGKRDSMHFALRLRDILPNREIELLQVRRKFSNKQNKSNEIKPWILLKRESGSFSIKIDKDAVLSPEYQMWQINSLPDSQAGKKYASVTVQLSGTDGVTFVCDSYISLEGLYNDIVRIRKRVLN